MVDPGMFSESWMQKAANLRHQSDVRLARAMSKPHDTNELNAARAERTALDQQIGALASPGGPRAYGSGCGPNPTGYKHLNELGRGVDNATYQGRRNREITERTHGLGPTTGSHRTSETQHATGHRATPSWAGDTLPAHDYSQRRR